MRRFKTSNPPLAPVGESFPSGKVSVVIPARNEEKNIGHCLEYLLKQNHGNYEIICVNDRSSDKTAQIIEDIRNRSKIPMKHITIEKLPPGWTGKNHAMFTGSKAVTGEWILFTDADTTHKPESISTALKCAIQENIDFLTLAPETESKTFWEKVVQPLAVSSLALWFRADKLNDPKSGITLANGQFILVKKTAYESAGGNESVKDQVVEDVELAKRMKSSGFNVRFLNGTRIYSTRMYSSLKEILTGWKRIFTYLFEKKILPITHKIFLFLFVSLLPFTVLLFQSAWLFKGSPFFSKQLFILSLSVSTLIVLIRAAGNKTIKTNLAYAVFHPLGSLVMIWILLGCIGRIVGKRPSVWRGDVYK